MEKYKTGRNIKLVVQEENSKVFICSINPIPHGGGGGGGGGAFDARSKFD